MGIKIVIPPAPLGAAWDPTTVIQSRPLGAAWDHRDATEGHAIDLWAIKF